MINYKLRFKGIILILMIVLKPSEETNFLKSIFQQVKEFRPFQTIIMIDGRVDIKETKKIVKDIIKETPSRVINFLEESPNDFRSSVAFRSIHETTIFLTIQSEETDPKAPLEFLMKVSGPYTHPRCLMIIFLEGTSGSREELLRFGWSKNFLDLTVIDLKQNWDQQLQSEDLERVVYHYFNPFNDTYQRSYFRGEPIFPNKLLDLKGYEMKVESYHVPPMVFVASNLSAPSVYGPEVNIVSVLSEKMNFKVSQDLSENVIGRPTCNGSKTMGLVGKLERNEMRFMTNNLAYRVRCKEDPITTIFITEKISFFPLVPILTQTSYSWSTTRESSYMGLLICLIVIFISLVLRLLNFDKRFWKPFNFVAMLLGIPVPEDVSKVSDRIALTFILFGFWLFSTAFFVVLTDFNIIAESMELINSLEDLEKSNLVPLMNSNIYRNLMSMKKDPTLEALMKKSTDTYHSQENCVQLLLQGKNVTCVSFESESHFAILQNLDETGLPKMKILKESFVEAPKAMFFETNSPFVPEIERILGWFEQSGLRGKWNKDFEPPTVRRETISFSDTSNLAVNLVFFLLLGYGISILAFIGELLINYLKNGINTRTELNEGFDS